MTQIAFGFNHDELKKALDSSPNIDHVLISLCNLKKPTNGITSLHLAAHFCGANGEPLEARIFQLGCPFPPGWDPADHAPGFPGGGARYELNFLDLKGAPKFKIKKNELLQILGRNSFTPNPATLPKQLLATIEASNGSQPLQTFVRFVTDSGEVTRTVGGIDTNVAATVAV